MRSLPCRAYISLDQIGLLDGNIEVLLVSKLYLDVVTFAYPVYLQEDSDSVVHMNDVVAFVKLDEAVQSGTLGVLKGLYYLLLTPEDFTFTEDNKALAAN